jgi:hypothetical protein
MGSIKLGGVVAWKDGRSPVAGARVRIYDVDSGGNGNDLIFDQVVGEDGKFRGESTEWKDTNTVPVAFGASMPVPDALLLEFRVKLPDGRAHTGPYLHLGDYSSWPLIVPFPRTGTDGSVQKSQRELIHVLTVSEKVSEEDIVIYRVIEFAASTLTAAFNPFYKNDRVRMLHGPNATLERLKQELKSAASVPGIKAVDLVISPHGASEKIYFFPSETTAMEHVVKEIREIPEEYRRKFRAVFSTACFGASHCDEWLEAGFEVAAGSRQIYADAAFSYPAFIAMWTAGATFQEAVNVANAADALRVSDQAARIKFRGQRRHDLAGQVDSFREVRGDGGLRITSVP